MLCSWNKLIQSPAVSSDSAAINYFFNISQIAHLYWCNCLHDHNKGGVTVFCYLSVNYSQGVSQSKQDMIVNTYIPSIMVGMTCYNILL